MATAAEIYSQDLAFTNDLAVTNTGDLGLTSGFENLKDALMRRIFTNPGAIIHRPDFGVGLEQYLGGVNSLSAQARLASAIDDQLTQDPRVESVLGVSLQNDDTNPGQVLLVVQVQPVGLDSLTLTMNLEGVNGY